MAVIIISKYTQRIRLANIRNSERKESHNPSVVTQWIVLISH